ncbi:hypothetical protein Ae168Ps1_2734 [Pseudonocardia sp. Ae168_Ps1]|uniref:hypothetical protein n=1 Tax=unclassified Pseudonocardia TaxID=2619320 RepID=UPI00095F07C3|nr:MULTISPECIES: hypothetical protein [unclassified Pseudonocardia]OLL74346.1 hypothetical protein Ae150APs1_2724 [Pseudonocardia sp. Ae150A_Ps1]OLL80328.1 hypothetical protein Ae168Ps1_2734 [Pseudonocardia sp. Ae168_Ps1]OLL85546.1 hypothetical protein Ae263Ps1_2601c [Pseudonocardia sp. Ae263_Ps1]OLL94426.1 hypothetical protein Ae356Ps1_4323 [Pseudonocardia sp. Ae356_Ps1]
MGQVIKLPRPRGEGEEAGTTELGPTGVPVSVGSPGERLERSAGAVDECAAVAEDLIREARRLRAELMAGEEPDMQVALIAMTTHLAGIANALGETHTELDEITNETTGGGAA